MNIVVKHGVVRHLVGVLFVFTFAFTVSAAVPTPIAAWHGDFDVTTKGECTLVVGEGNTVADDGSTITIGSTEGVRVFWGTTQRRKYTVVVRYKDMAKPAEQHGAVLAGHAGGSSSGFMMSHAGDLWGMYNGKIYSNNSSVSYPHAEGNAGCYAMSYSLDIMEQSGAKGQDFYIKTGNGAWRHLMTNAGVIASNVDGTITGCVVAGPCPDVSFAYTPKTMQGMKIESIVVFPEPMTLQDISGYEFPAKTYSVEISEPGEYAWSKLPWRNNEIPVGDVTADAVEILCNADVTITDPSLVVTSGTMRCSGTGTLRFAGEAEFAVKGTGHMEINLATTNQAMTINGALTLTKGYWHLGRKAAGYKYFTISGENALTLCENATLAIYDGKIGSPVAGYGTIRSIDLLPRAGSLDVALQDAELWHGNCVLEEIDNVDFGALDPDKYGNETSKLTFNGFKNRYFKYVYPIPLEEDIAVFKPEMCVWNYRKTGIGFGVRGGATGAMAKIKKLSGDGAIVDLWPGNTNNPNHLLLIQNWEDFTGSIEVNSKLRVLFGTQATGSRHEEVGMVLIRSGGVPLSLDAHSKIHGWVTNAASAVFVQGTLKVVSAKAFCGGRVEVEEGGELVFDADKAQAVSDATLTDCSAEVDMSKITGGSAKFGTGLVRFTGTYSPFVLPSAAVSNLSSAVNIRIDGATVNGNLAAASRFGGNGTFGGGTLSILEGATLDLSWGTMTLAATATLAEAPSSFTVVDENYASTGEVKLFSLTEGATVDDSWQAITVNVVSADGTKSGYCKTVLRSDGLYGVRSGLTIRLR